MSQNNRSYFMLSKSSCKWCERASELFEEKGIELKEYKIDSLTDLTPVVKFYSQILHKIPTVPLIGYSEGTDVVLIGGYTDLEKHFN